MANTLYDHGRNLFATGGIDWTFANLKGVLVTSSYTPNLATDQFLNVIPGGDIISSGVALSGLAALAGVCSANPVVFSGVALGAVATYLIIYVDTGSSSTSPLIALINVGIGLPLTATGGNITCTFFGNEVFEL